MLPAMTQLSVKECLRFGWETFKKSPVLIAGGFLIGIGVMALSSLILDDTTQAPSLQTFLMGVANGVIGMIVEIGFVTFALRAHDNVGGLRVSDMWNPKPFWKYLAVQILVGITVLIGLVLLVVPGVIAAIGLLFSSYLIVDKGRGPIEAMKESWRVTKGNRWQLALLVLAVAVLNILGFMLVLVGLLVTIPVSMIAMAHAYRTLEHTASEVAPV
jgi:membrane-anchored glycerophosphoryl diester phosphodiesterase (GDPDase)